MWIANNSLICYTVFLLVCDCLVWGSKVEVIAPVPPVTQESTDGFRRIIQDAWDRNGASGYGQLKAELIFVQDQCIEDIENLGIGLTPASTLQVILGGATQCDVHAEFVQTNIIPQVKYKGPLSHCARYTTSLHPTWSHIAEATARFCQEAVLSEITILTHSSQTYKQRSEELYTQLTRSGISHITQVTWKSEPLYPFATKTVLLNVPLDDLPRVVCSLVHIEWVNEYSWIIPQDSVYQINSSALRCDQFQLKTVFILEFIWKFTKSEIFGEFVTKIQTEFSPVPTVSGIIDLALAYDATILLREAISVILGAKNSNSTEHFNKLLPTTLANLKFDGITGPVFVNMQGRRLFNIKLTQMEGKDMQTLSSWDGEKYNPPVDQAVVMSSLTNTPMVVLDGIPLYLLAVMCSFAAVGIIYAITILVFNIYYKTDKVIKMTSPNINVLILLGCILAYGTMIPLCQDSSRVSKDTMAILMQLVTYLLAVAFTLVYGSLLAKSWRVYLIFRNLNSNGKFTRDEHLILGVFLMIIIDLAILLPWTFVDPIQCGTSNTTTEFKGILLESVRQTDVCGSNLLVLWILILYAYKSFLLVLAVYFTWKTRKVTLPALRDANYVYICVYTVGSFALIGLPLILTNTAGPKLKLSVGALTILIATTATISLLFIPKVQLYRKQDKKASDDTKMMFSESLRQTQKADGRCRWWACCGGESSGDHYGQEVLTSEIEHLNRTIKQKETTIRELTDRLYFETEKKNKGYYNSPKYQHYMVQSQQRRDEHVEIEPKTSPHEMDEYYMDKDGYMYRVRNNQIVQKSNRLDEGDLAEKYRYSPGMERPFKSPKLQRRELERMNSFKSDKSSLDEDEISLHQLSVEELDAHIAQIHTIPDNRVIFADPNFNKTMVGYQTEEIVSKMRKTPSPNEDSAIENVSPSTDSSERGSYQESSALRRVAPSLTQTSDYEMEYIDREPTSCPPWYLEGLEAAEYPFSPQLPTSTPKPKKLQVSQI